LDTVYSANLAQFSRKEKKRKIWVFLEVTACTSVYWLRDKLLCRDGTKICGFTSPHLVAMEDDSSPEQISLTIQFIWNVTP
jgi:hypothetical protein